MGDHWLILIPTDPDWVPDAHQAIKAREAVDQLTPARDGEIETCAPGRVEFVNCGENFESIGCRRRDARREVVAGTHVRGL
jgi:hypothetical protein